MIKLFQYQHSTLFTSLYNAPILLMAYFYVKEGRGHYTQKYGSFCNYLTTSVTWQGGLNTFNVNRLSVFDEYTLLSELHIDRIFVIGGTNAD